MGFEIHEGQPRRLHRSHPTYGASVGIMILDTGFQRFPGDIGYAETFAFNVQYAVLRGVHFGADLKPDQGTLEKFFRVIDDLVALGVDGITTSCGFLAVMQPHLTEYSPVPVASSSLLQIPLVQRILPKNKRIGVVTAKKPNLSPAHFEGVGAPTDLPVAGMPLDGVFRRNMETRNPNIDLAAQEAEVIEVVRGLLRENPDIGALVLECTNLSPYSHAIEKLFGLPVYDVITMINWFHSGLRPTRYA